MHKMEQDTGSGRDFYEGAMAEKMISYRIHGNPRISAAVNTVAKYVHEHDLVLDLGCGIGIATEQIGRKVKGTTVFGIDWSEANITYARRTVRASNVRFELADLVKNFASIESILERKADVVVMIDVIEHVPPLERRALFANIDRITAETGKLVMTFPSTIYQDYLRQHTPEKLQPIDESISAELLAEELSGAGFGILYYESCDVWLPGQYVHCVAMKKFAQRSQLVAAAEAPRRRSWLSSFIKNIRARWRRHWYVDRLR